MKVLAGLGQHGVQGAQHRVVQDIPGTVMRGLSTWTRITLNPKPKQCDLHSSRLENLCICSQGCQTFSSQGDDHRGRCHRLCHHETLFLRLYKIRNRQNLVKRRPDSGVYPTMLNMSQSVMLVHKGQGLELWDGTSAAAS